MPATILPFARREHPGLEPERDPLAPDRPRLPPLAAPRPRGRPTSRQIAHRWTMLSHLRRHFARGGPPDTMT
jgi:hypothetical protein